MKTALRCLPIALTLISCTSDTIPGPGADMAGVPTAKPDLAPAPDLGWAGFDLAHGPPLLAPTGTVKADCGPADGPAMRFLVGAPSQCPPSQGAAATAEFYTYTSSAPAAGQRWTYVEGGGNANNMSVTFCPQGNAGPCNAPVNASLAVDSVNGNMVGVSWTLTLRDGGIYGGTATVVVCPSMPVCG